PKHKTSQKFTAVGSLVYLTSVTAVGSVAISHIWAVSNGDVQPFLPYISDSGGDPPQSALFGFGAITTAIALMIIFSLRYITVKDITKRTKDASLIRLFNYLTFVAGLGVFLGLVMVATNATGHLRRDGTWLQPIMLPHLLGVSVFFVSGFSYLLGNSVLTWVLVPRFHNVWVAYARIVITLVNLISCIPTVVKYPNDLMSMKPHPYHPRQYPEGTLVSILGEWATVGTFMLYLYTMKSELDMTVIVLGLRRRLNTITAISVVAEGSNSTPQCPKYPIGPLQKHSSSQPRPLDPSQDPPRGR
ncbi:unnamed protein product, partial [Ixodes persulcatus]